MSIKALHFAFALSFLLGFAGAARAESSWEETHGRRVEVNDHLAQQNERVREEHHEQQLRAERAHEVDRHDHHVRIEER
jgi:hypothetical protein